jgi:REP element-mobilizing transposase RayT
MPRQPRLDTAGYYHIINRGVNRTNVFYSAFDKEQFLKILCKACQIYKVVIHDYCLMDNHYHLLLQTTADNLSLFMRQINSNYAIYFNKRSGRSGHLWQGRYLSYYVYDDAYLMILFKYIEHNPIEANMCSKIGEYEFTLLGTLLTKKLDVIQCAQKSRLKEIINDHSMLSYLEMSLTENELENIKEEQKRKIELKDDQIKRSKSKTLTEHFDVEEGFLERDLAILNAVFDGYTQSSIAKYLNLSPSAIYKVVKKHR